MRSRSVVTPGRIGFGRLSYSVAPVIAGLEIESGGRYLRRAGQPLPLFIESGWEHARMTSTNWQSYLDSIAALGYNGVYNQGPLNSTLDATDDNGNAWFNGTFSANVWDITQPNAAAFANIRAALLYAQSKSIVSFFFPAYAGFPGTSEGLLGSMQAATGAQCEAYGNYIGNLIKDIPALVVALGGDDIPDSTDLEKYRRLVVGIKANDISGRIYTWHASRGESSYDLDNVTAGYVAALGVPFVDWGYSGTTPVTSFVVLNSYAVPHTVYLGEGYYDQSATHLSDEPILRRQAWGAWLSGAFGAAFGDINRYEFQSGWQATLSRTGVTHDGYCRNFIKAREWWKFVPSTSGFVTSGGGTSNTTGYKPRCVSSDGRVALVYVGDGSSTTLDKSFLTSAFTARWFDPTNGTYTAIGTGISNSGTQAYTTPGSNSAGASDWVWAGEVP